MKTDDLDIPAFLQRPDGQTSLVEAQSNTQDLSHSDEAETPDLLPIDSPPTIEQILETVRKLGVKIDELTETRRLLKKQAEAMVRKL